MSQHGHRTTYVVILYESERVICATENLRTAAEHLNPGTTFGAGHTIPEATALALLRARNWQHARKAAG